MIHFLYSYSLHHRSMDIPPQQKFPHHHNARSHAIISPNKPSLTHVLLLTRLLLSTLSKDMLRVTLQILQCLPWV